MDNRDLMSDEVKALALGACVNDRDVNGNTLLHQAVQNGDLSLVLTYIAFGADVNARNNKEESVRHLAAINRRRCSEILYVLHAVGAERCRRTMTSCAEGCIVDGNFNGTAPENCDFSWKDEATLAEVLADDSGVGMRVLCLDGGGIRGLLLIQMLDELEKLMGRPIVECFDFIAGTSTGGILALALARGKTLCECRGLYFRLKDKVFSGKRPYDVQPLEKFLKEELGESTVMGDIKKPRLMITATRGDRKPVDLHIFRNYKSPLEILNQEERDPLTNEIVPNPRNQLIWQVARASGAAPTYFKPWEDFMDGGLISNNPTLDTLAEIFQCNQAARAVGNLDEVSSIRVLVSLGTGRPPLVKAKPIDLYWPNSFLDVCLQTLDIMNLGQMFIDQATQTNGRVTARASALCSELRIPYYRLNPQLTKDVALNETNNKKLVKMLCETTAFMRGMSTELLTLKTLLEERPMREGCVIL